MERNINYNSLLSELFDQWKKKNYTEEDRAKFCEDGIMLKNDSSIDVDLLWEQASRRVIFMLKDCPDGDGYDTREMLTDKYAAEKGEKNRKLKVKFLKNLAKLLYGLLEMSSDNVDVFNDKYVDKRMLDVISCCYKGISSFRSSKLEGI